MKTTELTDADVDAILETIEDYPAERVAALYERFQIQKRTGMKLCNRADGVNGHFCIDRPIRPDEPYYEFYNKGKWCSAGEVFIGTEAAEAKLKELATEQKISIKDIRGELSSETYERFNG
jgi:hypothetical protein